ncbi:MULTISPECIES: hypothetical protein [Microcoleaceae]|nr:hypothetical protein [Tychonema sp. LEGE 06208]
MTIIAHPVQDPEKRTPGFKSLGIWVRSDAMFLVSQSIYLNN